MITDTENARADEIVLEAILNAKLALGIDYKEILKLAGYENPQDNTSLTFAKRASNAIYGVIYLSQNKE